MKAQLKQQRRLRLIMLTIALSLFYANAIQAASDIFSFNNNVYNSQTTLVGSAPWLNLQIADTATAGNLQFTVSTLNLIGSEQVTGLFLNIPTPIVASLTGITISNPSPSADAPLAFISGSSTSGANSVFSASQGITTSAPASATGKYDIYVKFPAGALQGSTTETFNLIFASNSALPNAASFLTASLSSGNGSTFDAAAAFTNAGGSGGTGLSVVTASVVPIPSAIWLFGSAFVGFFGFNRRKQL